MISLLNVTKEYCVDEETVIAPVRDVSLKIEAHEFVIIIGRSGSGKTTLLNLMAGLVRPTSGQVLVDNRDLRRLSDRELSLLRAQEIGFVFQFPSLLPSLNVMENVVMPTSFQRRDAHAESNDRAAELLQMVGLSAKAVSLPRQLSAGEQKRAVLARSLMTQPRILLADEPTSDLDEQTEHEIIALLRNINASGVTIVMVTHSLELLPYATRAFKMENGALLPLNSTIPSHGPI